MKHIERKATSEWMNFLGLLVDELMRLAVELEVNPARRARPRSNKNRASRP
jgi:hypothetical protein